MIALAMAIEAGRLNKHFGRAARHSFLDARPRG
jgi:hypothetical protein